jgi:ABC-2 type transport system permease protein
MEMDFEGIPVDIAASIADRMMANMPNMVTMQATIFAGMGLIMVISGIVAENIEKKNLLFLMMAGVKPLSYLAGISGVILFVSFFTSAAFSLIGEFSGVDFWIFTAAMMSGVMASIVLGATIGIITKNQQSASGLSLPAAIIFGFGPMVAQFNETIARYLHPVYTQQLNVIANTLTSGAAETPLWQSFAIIWANVAVLGVLFAVVYKRKGLSE